MNMDTKQMNMICNLVKSISDGRKTLKEAKLEAEDEGINPNSFNDYLSYIICSLTLSYRLRSYKVLFLRKGNPYRPPRGSRL